MKVVENDETGRARCGVISSLKRIKGLAGHLVGSDRRTRSVRDSQLLVVLLVAEQKVQNANENLFLVVQLQKFTAGKRK